MTLDYYKYSDPLEHVKWKFEPGPSSKNPYTIRSYFTLKCLTEFFVDKLSSVERSSLKVIDYGSGPYMVNVISAVPVAAEIVLAEFSEAYRDFVQKWLNGECPFDWSPVLEHVVKTLEGRPEEDVALCEKELRNKISAVVPCDITQDRIIAEGFEGPYDVVLNLHVLEAAYDTLEAYKAGFTKVAALVKEGGYLIISTSKRDHHVNGERGFYVMNGVKFFDILPTSRLFLVEILSQNGFADICEHFIPIEATADTNVQGFYFFSAQKRAS